MATIYNPPPPPPKKKKEKKRIGRKTTVDTILNKFLLYGHIIF